MFSSTGVIPWRGAFGGTSTVPTRPTPSLRSADIAGGVVEVNGEEQIDTRFARGIKTVTLTVNANNFSPNGPSRVSWYQLDAVNEPSKFVIRVEKGGSNEGELADEAIEVAWLAWEN